MHKISIVLSLALLISCSSPNKKKEIALYNSYCSSCHLAPSIESLPKEIWEKAVLPDMGARMGIKDTSYNPYEKLSFKEQEAILSTGIYPSRPTIEKADWEQLCEYIISMAPDSLTIPAGQPIAKELIHFVPHPRSLDGQRGALYTFLKFNKEENLLELGDMRGNLYGYDYLEEKTELKRQFGRPIIDVDRKKNEEYVTLIGYMDPSELASGQILTVKNDKLGVLPQIFHRPVNTLVDDLDGDGIEELVVSEFGNLTGRLSLLIKKDTLYQQRTLLNQPGTIKVVSRDMDKDGLKDLVVLTSQGDESITILYQKEDLNFKPEKAIRFSPVFGSSWFELIDYDGDGDDDIITVNGDNADKSYIDKPYHGMRIHINAGNNIFEETYFYPLHGATRLVAKDFDQDGDMDFGLLSTFPDYENKPEYSFVYLENKSDVTFEFEPSTFKGAVLGRWFLMDTGDIDGDGDDDIFLSSFTYSFTPVPDELSKLWNEKNIDLIILENKLKNNSP